MKKKEKERQAKIKKDMKEDLAFDNPMMAAFRNAVKDKETKEKK